MCIRDRPNVDAMEFFINEIFPILHSLKTDLKLLIIGSNICLLYTSDAADERSSVDLGGRRIIKKKKHKKISGGVRVTI